MDDGERWKKVREELADMVSVVSACVVFLRKLPLPAPAVQALDDADASIKRVIAVMVAT